MVTSDVLDHNSLQAFLAARRDGRSIRWRGMCWQIQQHEESTSRNGEHSFWLRSAPTGDCT